LTFLKKYDIIYIENKKRNEIFIQLKRKNLIFIKKYDIIYIENKKRFLYIP